MSCREFTIHTGIEIQAYFSTLESVVWWEESIPQPMSPSLVPSNHEKSSQKNDGKYETTELDCGLTQELGTNTQFILQPTVIKKKRQFDNSVALKHMHCVMSLSLTSTSILFWNFFHQLKQKLCTQSPIALSHPLFPNHINFFLVERDFQKYFVGC